MGRLFPKREVVGAAAIVILCFKLLFFSAVKEVQEEERAMVEFDSVFIWVQSHLTGRRRETPFAPFLCFFRLVIGVVVVVLWDGMEEEQGREMG